MCGVVCVLCAVSRVTSACVVCVESSTYDDATGERRQSREKAKGYIVIVVRNSPITIKSYTATCNIHVGIPHYIYETP